MMLFLAALQALPIPLDAAARAGLPAASATLTAHGTTQTCTGVWLRDLADRAGVPSGEAVRGPALASVIVAEARDGYRVAFSLGEIDTKLGNAAILVADRCNGQPIGDADGPLRLVVPGDARGARSVKQLQALRLAPVP